MPKSSHLRTGRYSEGGRIYFVTTAVRGRKPVFTDFHLGRLLVAELRSAHEDGLAESLAWVIMPDHFHWLVSLSRGSLATLIQRVKGRSALRINKKSGGIGSFWQNGYHEHALRFDDDLPAFARYVVANPLRAGLVERIGDYPLWDAVWL